MSAQFSAKISMLRREKDISQKQAAIDLGVSQALLSHYEKGIRECSLDFVTRCAHYYGVSTDYLLGLTGSRHGAGELSFFDTLESDTSLSAKTVLRALLYLSETAHDAGDDAEAFFNDFFSLSALQYTGAVSGDRDNRLSARILASDTLLREKAKDRRNQAAAPGGDNIALATVLAAGESRLRETIGRLFSDSSDE